MEKVYKGVHVVIGIIRSIFFNLRVLPLKKAIKLPIIISPFVKLKSLKGEIKIENSEIKFGMIKIGYGDVGIFDRVFSRTIFQINGEIKFLGKANIGHGSKISVGSKGKLILGENFEITAQTEIICHKKITFGKNVLINWDNLIMDVDFHKIYISGSNKQINNSKEIEVEDNVWIGCRNTILKGSKIKKGSIVGANSVIVHEFQEENILIVGNPAQIKKRNIYWEK